MKGDLSSLLMRSLVFPVCSPPVSHAESQDEVKEDSEEKKTDDVSRQGTRVKTAVVSCKHFSSVVTFPSHTQPESFLTTTSYSLLLCAGLQVEAVPQEDQEKTQKKPGRRGRPPKAATVAAAAAAAAAEDPGEHKKGADSQAGSQSK